MMTDDDLDKLLSDVESAQDHTEARQESLRQKQRAARKSDTNTAGASGSGAEPDHIERLKALSADEDIETFRGGIISALQNHTALTLRFKQRIQDFSGQETIQELVQKHTYAFMRCNENIEKLYDDYSLVLSMDALAREAAKDFVLFFEGFEDENKIDFLILKELFVKLREFNSRVKKEWSELSTGINVLNLVQEGKGLFLELNSTVSLALHLCAATDKFLRYLAAVLSIPDEDYDVLGKDVFNKIIFKDSRVYRFDSLFDFAEQEDETGGNFEQSGFLDLDEPRRSGPTKMKNVRAEDSAEHTREDMTGAARSERQHEPAEPEKRTSPAAVSREIRFTVRGKSSWNTKEPYILPVNREKLNKDYEDLSAAFFFVGGAEDSASLEGAVKRAMIRYLSDNSKTIEGEYEEYLYKTIVRHAESIKTFFGFQGDTGHLFMYHLGPLVVHRLLLSSFQARMIGMCFKYLAGNKVVRFIPGEFIKEKVLHWYEENINPLDLEFDKIQIYDDIRRAVSKKYSEELEKHSRQMDDLIARMKPEARVRFDRDEFFKSKWNAWFGPENMVVYNRFIERTIFK